MAGSIALVDVCADAVCEYRLDFSLSFYWMGWLGLILLPFGFYLVMYFVFQVIYGIHSI